MSPASFAKAASKLAGHSTTWLLVASLALGLFHYLEASAEVWRNASGAVTLLGIALAWVLMCEGAPADTEGESD